MSPAFRVLPLDGADDWSVDAVPEDGGVALVIGFPVSSGPLTLTLRLERDEARLYARAILAAAGDATERTFTGGSGT